MESRRKRSRSQILKWCCYVLGLFVCAALQTTPGLTPELRMLELYRNTGGVLGMCAGGTFLAIPCPSGEWAVTNGLQLQRQWSSPFAIDTYPIS